MFGMQNNIAIAAKNLIDSAGVFHIAGTSATNVLIVNAAVTNNAQALGFGNVVTNGTSTFVLASLANQPLGWVQLDANANWAGNFVARTNTAAILGPSVLLAGQPFYFTDTGKFGFADGVNTCTAITLGTQTFVNVITPTISSVSNIQCPSSNWLTNIGDMANLSGLGAAYLTIDNGTNQAAIFNNLNVKLGGHLAGGFPLGGFSVRPGAGTGATISATGSDTSGSITLTIGTTPSANAELARVAYGFGYNVIPTVIVIPTNTNAASSGIYMSQALSGLTKFSLSSGTNAPPVGVHTFNYLVVGALGL